MQASSSETSVMALDSFRFSFGMDDDDDIIENIDKKIQLSKDSLKEKIILGKSKATDLPLISPACPKKKIGPVSFNFYDTESRKGMDEVYAEFSKIEKRARELVDVPPTKNEFTLSQVYIIETIAHDIRAKATTEKDLAKRIAMFADAYNLYMGAVMASEIPTGIKMVNQFVKDKFKKLLIWTTVYAPVDERNDECLRFLAHTFAGMALCALYGSQCHSRFMAAASAAMSWDSVDSLVLGLTLRGVFLLYMRHTLKITGWRRVENKGFFVVGYVDFMSLDGSFLDQNAVQNFPNVFVELTKMNIIPIILYKGETSMLERERALIPNEDWEATLDTAREFNIRALKRFAGELPTPTDKSPRIHMVNGKPIERLCGRCGEFEGDAKFFRCSACLSVYYCSVPCQHADWKHHKPACKEVQRKTEASKSPAASRV